LGSTSLIVVEGGGKSICSCGYSSQRNWKNDSSSNIFPSELARQVRPRRSQSDRGGSPPAPRKASAWNGNKQSIFFPKHL